MPETRAKWPQLFSPGQLRAPARNGVMEDAWLGSMWMDAVFFIATAAMATCIVVLYWDILVRGGMPADDQQLPGMYRWLVAIKTHRKDATSAE